MSNERQVAASRLPPKLYFRIGEVASLVGVEPHVLRYWEREFRSIRPTKSAKGQRVYSRRDVENLMRVRELLYQEGFTIAGAKKRLERGPARDVTRDVSKEASSDASREAARETETETEKAAETQGETTVAVAAAHAAAAEGSKRIRAALSEMRSEVEAFLAELG
ncbi:MAG: MerR family transcriptional regulator [Polyangiaceae bacterium]